MRLSWNEARARVAAFAIEWCDAAYEKGETQSFYSEFFDVCGVRRRTVARFEAHVAKLDKRAGYIDLSRAYYQAAEYFDALPDPERDRPPLHSGLRAYAGTVARTDRKASEPPLAALTAVRASRVLGTSTCRRWYPRT